jgi:hypothetical protein
MDEVSVQVQWALWKLKGTAETSFGDIGILIRLQFPDDLVLHHEPTQVELEGAAFLEAKRMYWETNRYNQLKSSQLESILSHTPFAKVLLYDRGIPWNGCDKQFAMVVPANAALVAGTNTRSLHCLGTPLPEQILYRYFHGQDLDYRPEIVEAVKGYSARLRPPKWVLTAGVGVAGFTPVMPHINEALFRQGPDG